ncbi:hypothetical protein XENOCAPTIV_007602, partial [Xenoophorus captivus]
LFGLQHQLTGSTHNPNTLIHSRAWSSLIPEEPKERSDSMNKNEAAGFRLNDFIHALHTVEEDEGFNRIRSE